MEWLKADFHTHTNDCIFDGVPHTACQLIDRAAQQGFRALALTNHRYVMFSACWRDYALERGIILFFGVEAEIQRRHVLIINATRDADRLRTFEDLKAYRRMNDSLIVAPHPFYPSLICLRQKLRQYRDLFDALEYNSFYTSFFNPNRQAVKFAQAQDLPLLGGSDAHQLSMLGSTYSLIKADFNAESIMQAVRNGQIKIATQPLQALEALQLISTLRWNSLRTDLKRIFIRRPPQCNYKPYPSEPLLWPVSQAASSGPAS